MTHNVRRQRGFALAALMSPSTWTLGLAAALALSGVVMWGMWQHSKFQGEVIDRQESVIAAQAEESRRQRLYSKASDEAIQEAERLANRARRSAQRYQRELDKATTESDPCHRARVLRQCGADADRLRNHAAGAGIVRMPGAGPASARPSAGRPAADRGRQR